MKLEFDLENSTLSEYFNEDTEGHITFSEVFKEAVLKEFCIKASYDSDIRGFIKSEIKDGLHLKICEYKNEAAIKAIVDDVMREELSARRTGSLIFTDHYVANVKKAIEKNLGFVKNEIDSYIRRTVAEEVEKYIETLYAENKLKKYLDFKKLAADVLKIVEGKQ